MKNKKLQKLNHTQGRFYNKKKEISSRVESESDEDQLEQKPQKSYAILTLLLL